MRMNDSMSDMERNMKKIEEEETPRKHHKIGKALLVFLILLVVLGVVFVAAWRDGTGFDALHRYFNYGSTAESGVVAYRYDAENSNRFALIGDRLVVLSNTSLRLLAADGSEVWSTNVKMTNPALTQGGNYVAAYDVGGQSLYVLDENGQRLTIETENDEPLISAKLNQKGMLAVTAGQRSQKGIVSVYDADMQLIFQYHSSRRFVSDAYVTDNGKYLAAVTLGQENSVFVSNIVLYDLKQTDPFGNYDIEDGLVVDMGSLQGQLVMVTDTALVFASDNGTITGTYEYSEPFLREYDIAGEDYVALLLNRYKSGSVGRLITVEPDGSEIASLDVHQEVLDLSANGRYLAVLYTDQLVIYNRELQVYSTLHGVGRAQNVLARGDGSVLILTADSAELFLP